MPAFQIDVKEIKPANNLVRLAIYLPCDICIQAHISYDDYSYLVDKGFFTRKKEGEIDGANVLNTSATYKCKIQK